MVKVTELVLGAIALHVNGSLAIIDGTNGTTRYPVTYKFKAGTRGYKGGPDDFKAVLGTVDLDAYNEAGGAEQERPAQNTPDFLLPEALKGLKSGDPIIMLHGRSQRQVTFRGYKPNRPKYPIQYELPTGGAYKGTLNAFVKKVEAS